MVIKNIPVKDRPPSKPASKYSAKIEELKAKHATNFGTKDDRIVIPSESDAIEVFKDYVYILDHYGIEKNGKINIYRFDLKIQNYCFESSLGSSELLNIIRNSATKHMAEIMQITFENCKFYNSISFSEISELALHFINSDIKGFNITSNISATGWERFKFEQCSIDKLLLKGIECSVPVTITNQSNVKELDISNSTFHKEISVDNSTFQKSVNSNSSTFTEHFKIYNCTFYAAPSFYSSAFKSQFVFTNNKFKYHNSTEAYDNYRCLEQIFAGKGMHIEQAEMHVNVLEARMQSQLHKFSTEWLISYAYCCFNHYGRSLILPMVWFVAFALLLALSYSENIICPPAEPEQLIGWQKQACASDLSRAVAYSVKNAFWPLAILTDMSFIVPRYWWFKALGTFQALFSTIWLYLFITTLRRRFKI